MYNSLWPHGLQNSGSSVLHCQNLLKFLFIESLRLSNHLILCSPLLLLPLIFPRIRVFSSELALHTCGQNVRASASASVLPMSIQDFIIFFFSLGLTGWFTCSPRDSQESSPAPQFKSIDSLVLSLLDELSHPYMTTGRTITLEEINCKWQTLFFFFFPLLNTKLKEASFNSVLMAPGSALS